MENSAIEWTTHTFNPWVGCSKCSPGCENCYAKAQESDRFGRVVWGRTGTRRRTTATCWKQPLKWNRQAEISGIRPRIFCASLADVFELYRGVGTADRPINLDQWRKDLFDLIENTPNLDWLLLSKRAAFACEYLQNRCLANVWAGVSVEDQAAAETRIPYLCRTPAAIRFLSCEPLLGPLNLQPYLKDIQWVIVGGESGTKARPMDPEWVKSIQDQCNLNKTPFFFKQWGGKNKKAAGRELEGQEWNEIPLTR